MLTSQMGTLDATPEQIAHLNNTLNGVLRRVVGVLNAADLTLPQSAIDALPAGGAAAAGSGADRAGGGRGGALLLLTQLAQL